jgi:hypothetical protein
MIATTPLSWALRRLLIALGALAALGGAPRHAAAASQVEIPLDKISFVDYAGKPMAVGDVSERKLVVHLDSDDCLLRLSDKPGSPAELIVWMGMFDANVWNISLSLPDGEVVQESVVKTPRFNAEGVLASFEMGGALRLKAGDLSDALPFKFSIGVIAMGQSYEHRPVEVYVVEDDWMVEERPDSTFYRFTFVYDASASDAAVRFALKREEIASKSGYQVKGDFVPFEETIAAGGKKPVLVEIELPGRSADERRGVYRIAAAGFDLFDRPFIVEYSLNLSPPTPGTTETAKALEP